MELKRIIVYVNERQFSALETVRESKNPRMSMYALVKGYVLEGLKRDLELRGYAKEEIHELTRKYDPRRQSHKTS